MYLGLMKDLGLISARSGYTRIRNEETNTIIDVSKKGNMMGNMIIIIGTRVHNIKHDVQNVVPKIFTNTSRTYNLILSMFIETPFIIGCDIYGNRINAVIKSYLLCIPLFTNDYQRQT